MNIWKYYSSSYVYKKNYKGIIVAQVIFCRINAMGYKKIIYKLQCGR